MSVKQKQEEGLGAFIFQVIVPALLIALVFRTLLFQPVNIPSGSMKATLLVGDYLMVSKFTYGYSRYSIPFSPPLFSGRIFASQPNRGDIVVFRSPTDPSTDLIKRIIGLPGERIQVMRGVVHINGTPVQHERIGAFVGEDPCQVRPAFGAVAQVERWRETLPNGVAFDTLDCPLPPLPRGSLDPDNTDVYAVPAERYFMMGDNRHNSTDSRYLEVGYVPFENLIGRAQMIFFSVAEGESAWQVWRWPQSVRWERIGKLVR